MCAKCCARALKGKAKDVARALGARANGEDLKVQQELLRHADIRTTMNVYTQAMTEQKRQAHTKIVRLVLNTNLIAP